MESPASPFIVIPTYWTWLSTESDRPVTAAYDHPTPLDGESTLPLLLEDLSAQQSTGFRVLILTGLAHPDLAAPASAHVSRLLEPFRERLAIHLCDAAALDALGASLNLTRTQDELLHLRSYAGIRNLQLLVPQILDAHLIVALDDDERLRPDYTARAFSQVGRTVAGQTVLGLAGPYGQPDGGILLKEAPPTGNVFKDKARYINAAMRMLAARPDRIVPTPMALGGNMAFHRDLYTRVCFDPGITRGEDIDYLINARLQGIPWWFDPGLEILHAPPRHLETPAYQRTREDVFRFVYEREKLRLHGQVTPDWLEPYPAALLRDDILEHAQAALLAEATPELVERFGDPAAIVNAAQDHAAHNASRLPAFIQAWAELMARIEQDSALRRASAALFPRL